jgi:hypothetical protein
LGVRPERKGGEEEETKKAPLNLILCFFQHNKSADFFGPLVFYN